MAKEEVRPMLQANSKGTIMQSLGKCILIFQNDPLLKGAIRTSQPPCKVIGRTYLLPWDGFPCWMNCEQ